MPSHAGPSSAVALPHRRALVTVLLLLLLAPVACQPPATGTGSEAELAHVDSILTELGGQPTADMSRGQRWRMISSIGAGLPPSNFDARALPDVSSRGAIVLQTYCERCHWLPAPQMHAAAEWPVLVRRMVLRARTLQDRMGGPVIREMLGDILMSGMASADVPSGEELDSLVSYLQAHAMPVAQPGELGDDEESRFFQGMCSACHEVPSPSAHTASEWPAVVGRMRMNAALMDAPLMGEDDVNRVTSFLMDRAGG